MTRKLSKSRINKSKIQNKFLQWPSRENFLALKKAKHFCNTLSKRTRKNYFEKVSKQGFANNKAFWNTVKRFLTNKCFLVNENIAIRNSDKIVTYKIELVELFDSHYISIVEKRSGIPPEIEGIPELENYDQFTVKYIIAKHESHSSIVNI